MTEMEQTPSDTIKIVEEIRTDETGRRIKVTRKIRLRLVSSQVCPEVARRHTWRKFGDAISDGPGPNISSTIVGEPVFLKLSMNRDHDREPVKAAVVEAKNIVCRYCQGGHWSAKCPYKSTFAEEVAAADASKDEPAKLKYIPPSQRRAIEAGLDPSAASSHRDNPNTIRISNLSEVCTDADIRDLVSRIVTPARVYVVKDQRTMLCRGSAFVSFVLLEDAERVISILNGRPYGNLILHVEMAKPQAP
jgi:translation initiation factor 3 subunit G